MCKLGCILLQALMYEGKRQFGDKLVSEKDKEKLDDIFDKVIDMEYSVKTATKILKGLFVYILFTYN